jgi:hypothetical protein
MSVSSSFAAMGSPLSKSDRVRLGRVAELVSSHLKSNEIPLGDLEVRPSRTHGVLVNITLQRTHGLIGLYGHEQVLSQAIQSELPDTGAQFFWRYRPVPNKKES